MNMKHLLLSWPAVAGFVLASLCFAAQALAEDAPAATKAYTLDEVFVTAQKREGKSPGRARKRDRPVRNRNRRRGY